jgi:hypothetical protein
MLIVDAQIHLWNAGNPTSPWHRQIPAYLEGDALTEMDAGGVDAAILTPHTSWDPNANELCLEAALSVNGVDMVQWGGSDYSMGIGRAGERYSPELRVVERRVFETAFKMGVPPRAEIATADQAKYFLDMGVRHFSVGTDITILHQWWKSQGEDLRKALGH